MSVRSHSRWVGRRTPTRVSPTRVLVAAWWLIACCAIGMAGARPGYAGQNAPIIAVFDVEAKGITLPMGTLDRLSDYLATSLAASGRFQVVPRTELKKRLTQQKSESYKRCYDQSCQIEIGKELAAEKSLACQVVRIGSRCAVMATLYDLRTAAAERGAKAKGGCDTDDVVAAVDTMVAKLAPEPASPAPPTPRVASIPSPAVNAAPPRQKVSVDLYSEPPAAEVFVDGTIAGMTPLRLSLFKGQRYALGVERPGYRARNVELTANARRTLRYQLELTEAGRDRMRTRTDWFSIEPSFGVVAGGRETLGGFTVHFSAFSINWNRFFWTILEFGTGGGFGDGTSNIGYAGIGTRVGMPFHLDALGKHRLKVGVGFGAGVFSDGTALISPAAQYVYHTDRRFFIGVGLRALLPTHEAGRFKVDTAPAVPEERRYYPAAVLVTVPMGWSSKGI